MNEQNIIIAGLVAGVGILMFFVCAFAKKDASCKPERHCGNCGNLDRYTGVECSKCLDAYPAAPNWTPVK